MELIPVSFESLSDIQYTVALAPHEKFRSPEFVMVSFSGIYRDGAAGNPDARFILAIMEAVQAAWFTTSLILDLRELAYHWGDEMEWIYGVGRFMPSPCYKPLAIVVGDGCRDALRSLSPAEFERTCVETVDEAVALIRVRKPEFDRCLDAWRRKPGGGSPQG